MPHFLDAPAAWLGFISTILGIISFFLPTDPSIHIDNSTNYYFETRESKGTQGLEFFIIAFSFLGIFISYSLIYPYFFAITVCLYFVMILKYLMLRITFTFEILRAFITLAAAYLLNYLPDSITHFWTSFNTFTSADLQGQSSLFNKLFLVIQQIIDLFLGIGNGNYFAVQLLFEVAILANIYAYFLSRIVKNKNNIKITRLKNVIYSLIGYSFLFLITINAQPILSAIIAWFQR